MNTSHDHAGIDSDGAANQARAELIAARDTLAGRRPRNFSRAVTIASKLQFAGVLRDDSESDFLEYELPVVIQVLVDALESYELDSPGGEITG
jgi:hypothetical protein